MDNNPLFNTLILEFDLFIDSDDQNNTIIFYTIIVSSIIIIGIGMTFFIYRSFKKAHKRPITELTIEI